MAPIIKIPLERGSLRISFNQGTDAKPFISSIAPDSQLQGKVQVGYQFSQLLLTNGVILENADTQELMRVLRNSSDDPDRILKVVMSYPTSTTVTLPPGDHGLIIKEKHGKPTLIRILPGYAKNLRVGMVVDRLRLVDGQELLGLSTEEYNEALLVHANDSERTLKLVSPNTTLSPRKNHSPSFSVKKIVLPRGSAKDFGLMFQSTSDTGVATIDETSNTMADLRSVLVPGYIVQTMRLPEGHQYDNLTGPALTTAIDSTQNVEGRILTIKNEVEETTAPTITISLPDEGGVKQLGFVTEGDPAKIMEIDPSSFLYDLVPSGQIISKVGWGETTAFEKLDADDVEEVLADSSGFPYRYIICTDELSYGKQDAASVAPSITGSVTPSVARSSALSVTPSMTPSEALSVGLPDTLELELPKGKIGVIFGGSPPTLLRMAKGSPLNGVAEIGMAVDTLTLPDSTIYTQLETMELVNALKSSADQEGRILRMINIEKIALSTQNASPSIGGGEAVRTDENDMTSEALELEALELKELELEALELASQEREERKLEDLPQNRQDLQEIQEAAQGLELMREHQQEVDSARDILLPTGKLRIAFKGKNPPAVIHKVKKNSALEKENITGMAVDTVTVDKVEHFELNSADVANLLKSTADIPGRVMKVRDPSSTKFKIIPDEMTLDIPSGTLGCSIVGLPPYVKAFRKDSPLANKIPPHMFIDGLALSNGYTRLGLKGSELISMLRASGDQEGRSLILLNSKTRQPSDAHEIFPKKLQVEFPSGKLGLSFKGRTKTRVSRVHEDSPLEGKVYAGMIVDTIDIPGGSIFSGLKANEVSRILKDTKRVEGRIVTFARADVQLMDRNEEALSEYSESRRN